MPRIGNYTDKETRAVLEQYIVPKECAAAPFPTALRPDWVSEGVRDIVKSKHTGRTMRRATEIVRFYALRDRVDQFVAFITGGEKTQTDVERTGNLITLVSELGTSAQQSAAVKEFDRLVASPAAAEGLEALIEAFFTLPPKTPSAGIQKRVSDLYTECERKGPEDKLGRFLECDARLLPWAISAKTRKDSILVMPPGPPRLQRWAEAYLAYENTTPFAWDRHAGFGLVQDARDQGDPAGAQAVAAAMGKIDPKKDDVEVTKFRKTRGYRARQFFLQPLNEEQEEDERDHSRSQEDLLV